MIKKDYMQNSSNKKSILELKHNEALKFFLKGESYCNFDLPPYITFDSMLQNINAHFKDKTNPFKYLKDSAGKICVESSHRILHNKDGKYDWRAYELIHPVLYVALANLITTKEYWEDLKKHFNYTNFKNCTKGKLHCSSIPVCATSKYKDKAEQINQWWEGIEQESIVLSLKFDHILQTDIANFYPSIYTHSISWALHTKDVAKNNKKSDLLGNKIDCLIQRMSYGQTNGIPQGSILMDFIAEIILAHIDSKLMSKIEHMEFEILRYRDDYRIFTNNPTDTETILKELSSVLADFGLKLNQKKTLASNQVIYSSIKEYKLKWMQTESLIKNQKTLQKQLTLLYLFSLQHQNCGTICKILTNINQAFEKPKKDKQDYWITNLKNENISSLIAIITDIAFLNPIAYSHSITLLSKLFEYENKETILLDCIKKLQKISNNGYMEIWLQRAIVKNDKIKLDEIKFDEKICKIINSQVNSLNDNNLNDLEVLWDNDWINSKKLKNFKNFVFFNKEKFNKLEVSIQSKETSIYEYQK